MQKQLGDLPYDSPLTAETGGIQNSDMRFRICPLSYEVLKGYRKGFHSIGVNEQWRIVFRWVGTDAHAVSLVDYYV